ncbi:MAG: TA system VapC family ribonuclease toxin [Chloroflexota bacterium]
MPDVNVLVYAHRPDDPVHPAYRAWLQEAVEQPEPLLLSVLVAVGFVRVVTNPRIHADPTPLSVAWAAIDRLARHPGCVVVGPGAGHLDLVGRLCRSVDAVGKQVADAQHAALAIAEGATWVTRDRDFAQYERHGLSWQHLALG